MACDKCGSPKILAYKDRQCSRCGLENASICEKCLDLAIKEEVQIISDQFQDDMNHLQGQLDEANDKLDSIRDAL